MAKIETNRYIASSLDNFIVFSNTNAQEAPYVDLNVADSLVGQTFTVLFEDADNAEGVKYSIEGSAGNYITKDTFNTAGDRFSLMYSLAECLKLNSFAYDVVIANTNTVRFGIDSSRRWKITSLRLGIGGNYAQYNPYSANKFVVNVRGELADGISQFSMSKYNDTPEVSFNISSPFQYITFKSPISISLNAYSVIGNQTKMETITNNRVTILPTTLSKFETVNYDDYFCSQYNYEKKKPLTRMDRRSYNYGEYYSLSILTDRSDADTTLTKRYYTNSGVFLSSDTGCVYREYQSNRLDFYDKLDLDGVEANSGHQVGYVEVTASYNGNDLTYPVTFEIVPRCVENDTLFFINAIGGIDSFTFMGERRESSDIDEQSIYRKNPKRPYTDTYELDFVKSKEMEDEITVTTHHIDRETALWLKELQRSRYVFKFNGVEDPKYTMVVVEEFPIEVSSNDRRFQLECTYRYADKSINV